MCSFDKKENHYCTIWQQTEPWWREKPWMAFIKRSMDLWPCQMTPFFQPFVTFVKEATMHVILAWKCLENLLRYFLIDWFGQLFGDAIYHGIVVAGAWWLQTPFIDSFMRMKFYFFSISSRLQFLHKHARLEAGGSSTFFKDTKNDISKKISSQRTPKRRRTYSFAYYTVVL